MEVKTKHHQNKAMAITLLTLIIVILWLVVFHFTAKVLVHEHIARPLAWLSIPLMLALIALQTYTFFKQDSQLRYQLARGQFKSPWMQYVAYMLMCLFGIPVFVFIAVSLGIPTTLHYLSYSLADDATMVVTIEKKSSSYKQKHCNGSVLIKEYQLLFNNSLCGLSSFDWHWVSPGDKLTLHGKQSIFGFSYDGYKVHTVNGIDIPKLLSGQSKEPKVKVD
ncbi:hypothetical protein V1358_17495 [Pseudoalteromonas sp. YIC-656]|uniref:hypothetical protein n=1 Tax=Pseudoalteromonas pernae TaxID=3118054 RepID=UPI0032429103